MNGRNCRVDSDVSFPSAAHPLRQALMFLQLAPASSAVDINHSGVVDVATVKGIGLMPDFD